MGHRFLKTFPNSRRSGVLLFDFLIWIMIAVSLHSKTEVKMTEQALATVADTAAITGSCNDPVIAAFIADLTYTLAFSSPSRITGPTCSTTVSLSGAVNGDSAPSVACSLTDQLGFAVMYNRTPTSKLGGLQCVTQDRSILQVHGDGSDDLNVDIGVMGTAATAWDASKKVDASTAASKIMLFGTSGQVGGSAIIDGSDHDTLINGEVVFGGATASQGASTIFIKLDYTNYNPSPSTAEDLTLTYTAQ